MAKTIMMIHGVSAGGWCWENYKIFFEKKGYHCVTPTLRFHDKNPNDKPDPRLGTVGLLDYIDDLEEEIRKLDTSPVLIGHSMGGLLVQILASRGLVKAAILLTPASPCGIMPTKLSAIRSFRSVLSRWGFWKKPFRQTFNEAVYSMIHLLSPEEQKKTFDKFVHESGRAISEIGFWFFDSKGAAEIDESKITCPVLVIAGTKDRLAPSSVVRKIADKYKTVSTYKEFKNHAHWIMGEPGWEGVAEFISNWLDNLFKNE